MSSKDFITRYFEQLGKVLAAVLGFRENKEYELAEKTIDQQLNELFQLDNKQVVSLSIEELTELVLKRKSVAYDAERAIAELIYQLSLTYMEMGQTEKSLDCAEKALAIFRAIDAQSGFFSLDIQERIISLNHQLTSKLNN